MPESERACQEMKAAMALAMAWLRRPSGQYTASMVSQRQTLMPCRNVPFASVQAMEDESVKLPYIVFTVLAHSAGGTSVRGSWHSWMRFSQSVILRTAMSGWRSRSAGPG